MKRVWLELAALTLGALLSGCGGSGGDGGGGDAGAVADGAAELVEEGVVAPPVKEWKEMAGIGVSGLTTVKGFGCNGEWLYLAVDGAATKGLYAWELAGGGKLEQIFGGVGLIEVVKKGVFMASFAANAGSLVQITPEEGPVDMGFTFENTEVKHMSTPSHLVSFSQDWTTGEFLLHRALLPGGPFEQVGPRSIETGMALHATSTLIYYLTVKNEVLGTACYQLPLTGNEASLPQACPGFPDFIADKNGEPYSVNARIYGFGNRMAAWFRVSDKGEQKARHYIAPEGSQWQEATGFPTVEPTAWFHDGDYIYAGYAGLGAQPPLYRAAYDLASPVSPAGDGLPAGPAKSGVAGICRSGSHLYAAWLDYNAGGSSVRIMRRTR